MIQFLTIEKFCEETGYTEDAIKGKIKREQWKDGREYFKAPDHRILISVEGYAEWVQQGSGRYRTKQSKSTSSIRAFGVVSASGSSPRPLT